MVPVFNTGRLVGLICPHCGSREPLNIESLVVVTVYDDSALDLQSDAEWRPDSRCSCVNCGHSATVRDFNEACTAAYDSRNSVGDALGRYAGRPENANRS
jgi:hypothetical protein